MAATWGRRLRSRGCPVRLIAATRPTRRFLCQLGYEGLLTTASHHRGSVHASRLTAPRSRISVVHETMSVMTDDARTSHRVLIAEDEALIRLDLAEMLREEGYDIVGEAGDGETAVRLTEELKPDLVILDIKMPIMDGLAAAEKIAGGRLAPVVILTAFSQRDLVERARAAGAMAYLVKPFQKSDLVPAIEIALSRFSEVSALETEVASLTDRLED